MSSVNIGWLFYKDYFKGIDYSRLDDVNNEKLIQEKVQNIIDSKPTLNELEIIGSTRFQATTTYPGLILGSGNAHEIPDVKGQAILGFHFDYTSGLPVIAGSSIKGVLRSAFKHKAYIEEYVGVEVEALEKEIFDNGDIFFDAEIIKADGFLKIMGDDYITPHNDPLKDPIPLRFIKVLPNVTFLFQFELCDGILSKSEKETLFRKILEDLGLGAKTNVGYGKFEVSNAAKSEEEQEIERLDRERFTFNEALESGKIENLEAFKRNFANSMYIDEIDKSIVNIKEQDKVADIKRAFDNLDKSKKNHVDAFIKKYSTDENAKEFIGELTSKNEQKSPQNLEGIKALDTAKDGKAFKKILMNLSSISDREVIRTNVKRICKALNKKKREKFFRESDLKKYIDEDFESEIKRFFDPK